VGPVTGHGERPCDLCGEVISRCGGYGSGSLADGLCCSLRCYALKSNRYVPPLTDLVEEKMSLCADDDQQP